MEFSFLPGEATVDLQYRGLFLLQKGTVAPLTTDAVLLASFVRAGGQDSLLELCSGGGGISLLVHARTGAHVTGLELSGEAVSLANRSLIYNGISEVSFIEGNVKDAAVLFPGRQFDGIMVNPPYFHGGTVSPDALRAGARHDSGGLLFEIAKGAKRLLKNGGRFFCIYPASGLSSALYALESECLCVKRIRFVLSKPNTPPKRVLIEAKKGGKEGLAYDPPLVLLNEDGTETRELAAIYHKETQSTGTKSEGESEWTAF